MEVKRLETAVENLSKVLKEIQREIREYDKKRSLWYDHQLEQFCSGLITGEEFHGKVWLQHQNTYRVFDVYHIAEMLSSLEIKYDAFLGLSKNLDSIVEGAIEAVPENWQRWIVTFRQRPCAVYKNVCLSVCSR